MAVVGQVGCIGQLAAFQLVPYLAGHAGLDGVADEEELWHRRQRGEGAADTAQMGVGCLPVLIRASRVDAALELAQRHVELGVTDDLGPLRLGAVLLRGAVEEADVDVLAAFASLPALFVAQTLLFGLDERYLEIIGEDTWQVTGIPCKCPHKVEIIQRMAEIREVVELATGGTNINAAYKAAAMLDKLMDEIRFDIPEEPTYPVDQSL